MMENESLFSIAPPRPFKGEGWGEGLSIQWFSFIGASMSNTPHPNLLPSRGEGALSAYSIVTRMNWNIVIHVSQAMLSFAMD